MNKIYIVVLLLASLPIGANAENKMRNTNPDAMSGKHMQNSDPSPASENAPVTEELSPYHMRNTNPNPGVKSDEAPVLSHHMQNRDPGLSDKSEPAKPEHTMENKNPNKIKADPKAAATLDIQHINMK